MCELLNNLGPFRAFCFERRQLVTADYGSSLIGTIIARHFYQWQFVTSIDGRSSFWTIADRKFELWQLDTRTVTAHFTRSRQPPNTSILPAITLAPVFPTALLKPKLDTTPHRPRWSVFCLSLRESRLPMRLQNFKEQEAPSPAHNLRAGNESMKRWKFPASRFIKFLFGLNFSLPFTVALRNTAEE